MASGYIEYHDNTGQALSKTDYTSVAITTSSVAPGLILPTSGCTWSHVEILITSTHSVSAGAEDPTTIEVFLAWDSDGKEIIAGPSTALNLVEHTTDTFSCAFDLGIVPTYPSSTTSPSSTNKARGTVHLFVKPNLVSAASGGSAADQTRLKIARLHWHQNTKG